MKRTLTLTLLVCLVLVRAHAQISIGANEMPHAGDELYLTRAFTNPFLNYGATGANHDWDFSNLSANTQDVTAYQTVASTNFVYAIAYADIFFNPNRANHAKAGVDIPFYELLPIENPYTFFYRSSTIYEKVGFGVELAGLPVPIAFNEHDVIYELPLDFADTSDSFSSWEVSIPTLAHYGFEQDRHNDVDGWGTITTPAGTFDVLRVKTTLQGRDTINIDSLSLGFTIDRPVIREYKWLAEGYRVPILQVNTTELFGFEVITDIFFYDEPRSITVVPPLASLCPGSSVEVNYDATGVFNPGSFLILPNVFTAQLSDSTGDFTNAVDIGSVQSTVSGTITVIIPANTPFGSGYRIRVVSNSPEFIGADNGYDLVIGAPPLAGISAGGPTEFCVGGSVVVSASGGGTYQWQLDGVDIPGATGADHEAFNSGDLSVIVTTGCGVDTSAVIIVTVYDLPEHLLDPASYLTCDGTPVTIVALELSGQTGLTYQWFLDGIAVNGATGISILASDAGDYTLIVTNPLSGCEFTTNAASVVVEFVPTPVILASDTTIFCEGGSVVLDAGGMPGASYQWTLDGVEIVGATSQTLLATASGSYAVVVTTGNGCSSTSDPIMVIVNPLPAPPVISASADTLFASGTGVFQWYLNGVEIPGATEAWYVAAISGDYTVTVTDGNGCSSTSDVYTYISTGMQGSAMSEPLICPNPSNGHLSVSGLEGAHWYEITDATGKIVQEGALAGSRAEIDLRDQRTGLYLLRVLRNGDVFTSRIVIER